MFSKSQNSAMLVTSGVVAMDVGRGRSGLPSMQFPHDTS
jgi:hypothetical protein